MVGIRRAEQERIFQESFEEAKSEMFNIRQNQTKKITYALKTSSRYSLKSINYLYLGLNKICD